MYNKLGLGKKNGNGVDVGMEPPPAADDDDDDDVFVELCASAGLELFPFPVVPPLALLASAESAAASMAPNPDRPKPARFANRFMLERFPRPPMEPRALGKPANGIRSGFLGSNWPKPERPERMLELRPPRPEVAKDGKFRLEARDVLMLAELTLEVEPVGLDNKGGRPGRPFLLVPDGKTKVDLTLCRILLPYLVFY